MSLLSVLGNFASWMTRNFYWIEPLLFTGFVATRLFKLAGALTNVGVAVGFIGKQTAGNSIVELVSGLTGLTSARGIKALSFANKRALVTALRAAGVSGKVRTGVPCCKAEPGPSPPVPDSPRCSPHRSLRAAVWSVLPVP